MNTPSINQLHQAVSIAEQIEKLKAELAALLGGSSAVSKFDPFRAVSVASPVQKNALQPNYAY